MRFTNSRPLNSGLRIATQRRPQPTPQGFLPHDAQARAGMLHLEVARDGPTALSASGLNAAPPRLLQGGGQHTGMRECTDAPAARLQVGQHFNPVPRC